MYFYLLYKTEDEGKNEISLFRIEDKSSFVFKKTILSFCTAYKKEKTIIRLMRLASRTVSKMSDWPTAPD